MFTEGKVWILFIYTSMICICCLENWALDKLGLMGATENAVRKAMAEWEEKTCIRFVERTNEKDYLQFVDNGYGQ